MVASLNDPVIAHQITELILFYETMTRKILGESAPLAHLIFELYEFSFRIFFDILQKQSNTLKKELTFIDSEFEPLVQVIRVMSQMVY